MDHRSLEGVQAQYDSRLSGQMHLSGPKVGLNPLKSRRFDREHLGIQTNFGRPQPPSNGVAQC